MALAHQDPAETKKQADDHELEQAMLAKSSARDGSTAGQAKPGARSGEGERDYGRQGGSVADTGRRTDDPVGAEQVESSAMSPPDAQTARERQEAPGSRPPER